MINQFKSGKAVISKVFRDLRLQETDWVTDGVEWMGEALQAIGAYTQLVRKVEIVKTTSHKATLPTDLYLIDQIRYGYYNTDSTTDPKLEDFTKIMPYESNSLHPALIDEYNDHKGAEWTEETFFIQEGYINTSFEADWIAIIYRAINVDNDGFPMVPDHYSFDQALYWFIVMKLLEGGMRHPSPRITWDVAESRWLKYCTQARTKAMMPDEAKYEEFARSWVNLIPNLNIDLKAEEESGFSTSNAYIVDEGNLKLLP